jgi:hypothetical protein
MRATQSTVSRAGRSLSVARTGRDSFLLPPIIELEETSRQLASAPAPSDPSTKDLPVLKRRCQMMAARALCERRYM